MQTLWTADGPVRIGVCLQGTGEVPTTRIVVHREPELDGMARGHWIATGLYHADDYWFSIDGHMYGLAAGLGHDVDRPTQAAGRECCSDIVPA